MYIVHGSLCVVKVAIGTTAYSACVIANQLELLVGY